MTSEYPVDYRGAVGPPYMPLIFPISQEVALIGNYNSGDDLQYVQANSDETYTINFGTIRAAFEKVYAPTSDKWIWEIWAQTLGLNDIQQQLFKQLAVWTR